MKIPLKLRCVAFDFQIYPAQGTTQLEFFESATIGKMGSAAKLSESELIQWLIDNPNIRDLLLEELSLSVAAKLATRVKQPFITDPSRKPGDIDLLACERDRPHQAVAVEWKRVKVRFDEGAEKVNGVESFGTAVEAQTKALYQLGFAKTYLGIVAIVDGRENDARNFLFRGTSNTTYMRVIDVVGGLNIMPEIGLIYTEIVQPINRHIDEAAMVCGAIVRAATYRDQRDQLTTQVANYFR
jgi:hypothetical protein